MNLNPRAIILNFLTLGYTGAMATHQTAKKIKEERSFPVVSEVAGFLWLVPAFGWFLFAVELLDIVPIASGELNLSLKEIYDVLWLFPGCFAYFSLIHFPVGLAVLQHLREQQKGSRAKVLWFAGYALESDLMENLNQTKLEPVAGENG